MIHLNLGTAQECANSRAGTVDLEGDHESWLSAMGDHYFEISFTTLGFALSSKSAWLKRSRVSQTVRSAKGFWLARFDVAGASSYAFRGLSLSSAGTTDGSETLLRSFSNALKTFPRLPVICSF